MAHKATEKPTQEKSDEAVDSRKGESANISSLHTNSLYPNVNIVKGFLTVVFGEKQALKSHYEVRLLRISKKNLSVGRL